MTTTSAISPTVLSDSHPDAARVSEPSQAAYLITSVVIATLVFFVGVGGGVWLSSGHAEIGFGVGLFTAFWGGPGFGLMAGFALYNLTVERNARRAGTAR